MAGALAVGHGLTITLPNHDAALIRPVETYLAVTLCPAGNGHRLPAGLQVSAKRAAPSRLAAKILAVCCQLHNTWKPHSMLGRIMANMETPSKDCQHHWMIDAADGPVSRGVFKLCRAEREFENVFGGAKWGYFRLPKSDNDASHYGRRNEPS